jgi:hypothetical protein
MDLTVQAKKKDSSKSNDINFYEDGAIEFYVRDKKH